MPMPLKITAASGCWTYIGQRAPSLDHTNKLTETESIYEYVCHAMRFTGYEFLAKSKTIADE